MLILLSADFIEVPQGQLTYQDLGRMDPAAIYMDEYTPAFLDLKTLDPLMEPTGLKFSYRNKLFSVRGTTHILPDKSVEYEHRGQWTYVETLDPLVELAILQIKFTDAEGNERTIEPDYSVEISHTLVTQGAEKPENRMYFYDPDLQRLFFSTFVENTYKHARTGVEFKHKIQQERLDLPGHEGKEVVWTFPQGTGPGMTEEKARRYIGAYMKVSETSPTLQKQIIHSQNNEIFMTYGFTLVLKKEAQEIPFTVITKTPQLKASYNPNATRYNFPYFPDGLFVRRLKEKTQQIWFKLGGNRADDVIFELPDTEEAIIVPPGLSLS